MTNDLDKLKHNYGSCHNCKIAMWGRHSKEEKFPNGIVICSVCQTIETIEEIKNNIKEMKNA